MKEQNDFKENEEYVKNTKYSLAPHIKRELDMMIAAYNEYGRSKSGMALSVDRRSGKNAIGRFFVAVDSSMLDMDNKELPIDKDYVGKYKLALSGQRLDVLENDCDYRVRMGVVEAGYNLEKFIRDGHYMVRCAVANRGIGLNVLVNDPDFRVRQQVAYKGFGLDRLINDSEHAVRSIVAHMGYGHDKLVTDESDDVRHAIAMRGNKLDILIRDKCIGVRMAVACNGYGLDKLIHDRSKKVSGLAQEIVRRKMAGEPIDTRELYNAFSRPAPRKK